jgi:hypothetical protein
MKSTKIENVTVTKEGNETCFFIPPTMSGTQFKQFKRKYKQQIKNL